MNQVSETFKRFDIFGQEIRLLATGQSAFRTKIGAFMTLALFAILAYSQMNKGKNAILNSKEAVISGEEGYTFNSSELIFAVGLLDNMGQPIPNDNNRVFTISFYYCNKSLNDTECVSIPGTICGNRIQEVSKQLNIPEEYEDITYCMDEEYIKQNPEIRIQGSTRQDNFTLLGALQQIQRCQNSTDYNYCASNDDIDQYIIEFLLKLQLIFILSISKMLIFITLILFINLTKNQINLPMRKHKVQMLHPCITKLENISKSISNTHKVNWSIIHFISFLLMPNMMVLNIKILQLILHQILKMIAVLLKQKLIQMQRKEFILQLIKHQWMWLLKLVVFLQSLELFLMLYYFQSNQFFIDSI